MIPPLLPDQLAQRHNTAWRIEPGRPDPADPVLEPAGPWESGCCNTHGGSLIDPVDGRWKLWYLANEVMAYEYRLCYAESADGVRWERPRLDLCPYDDRHRETNVLIDRSWGCNCHDGSVFVHRDAPPERRYEMFILLSRPRHLPTFRLRDFPLPPGEAQHRNGVYRLFSADGLRWRIAAGGDFFPTSDSVYVFRDGADGYVAYHKTEVPSFPGTLVPYDIGRGGCRVIARRTSPDGARWSDARLVLMPDWRDAHDTQFMDLHPHRVPGGYVAILTVYHALSGTIDLQFAASRDGLSWWRPDRRPCVGVRPLGDGASGQLWPAQQLVEHDGRLYCFFGGIEGLHHDVHATLPGEQVRSAGLPYREWRLAGESYRPWPSDLPDHGAVYRVSWEMGRFWALLPAAGGPSEAVFTTAPAALVGQRLSLNANVLEGGQLVAELLDGEGQPVPGFTAAECAPVRGDQRRLAVSWRGGEAAPVGAASVRFTMRRARLYGLELA